MTAIAAALLLGLLSILTIGDIVNIVDPGNGNTVAEEDNADNSNINGADSEDSDSTVDKDANGDIVADNSGSGSSENAGSSGTAGSAGNSGNNSGGSNSNDPSKTNPSGVNPGEDENPNQDKYSESYYRNIIKEKLSGFTYTITSTKALSDGHQYFILIASDKAGQPVYQTIIATGKKGKVTYSNTSGVPGF